MAKLSLRAVQKLTCKKRDAWWTVVLVDPVATRMLIVMARFKFITPNGVTWAALFLGLGSAGFFLRGDTASLFIGAALYHLSFILDCIDGKLARLKGNGTVFGGWLDYVFDRIRVLFCALALMGGQYLRSEDERFLLAALMVVFLDMLRYVDALQIYKMRMSMRAKIEKVTKEQQEAEAAAAASRAEEEVPQVRFMEDLLRENPEAEAELLKQQAGDAQVVDLHAQFRHRFPWYLRVRQALLRSRIRPHLISGIEFQMFVFIVGPLTGRILLTTVVSAVLMGVFELIIMYKFWLSTRDFTRVMADLNAAAPSTAGSIAPHLHRGRHRRGVPEQILADTELLNPQPEDDPGFQPYPQPYEPLIPGEWPPYAHEPQQSAGRAYDWETQPLRQARPVYTPQPYQQHSFPGEGGSVG
ncbi:MULTISPECIES: CDP-alcohol phosphatidyltransferase family protein [unclassified Streptomyces]|uniref:CDP-alcohol phosphatidyltransferase family protein n=1 Tax=unclassified Streptomyces TaxID=2593676 RepID=UPI001C0B0129|nr:CDP-alcohol phosphatidyltransferase family protein [Streptomyces sp. YPW6]QWQ40512.1 CDP-alcohol phosphatidyltransferase family protein [Streptomyces sp. YPW6]